MTNKYLVRLKKLQTLLLHHNFSGAVISKPQNIFYLTGTAQMHPVNREALLFVSVNQAILYHSSFLTPLKLPHLTYLDMRQSDSLAQAVLIFSNSTRSIAIEGNNLTVNELNNIQAKTNSVIFQAFEPLADKLRLQKDSNEKKAIKNACAITQAVMTDTQKFLQTTSTTGITEHALAVRIERSLIDKGANGLAFPVIVAFDENSALPHHVPGERKCTPQSVVLLDFGCQVDGYCSDMTRTIKRGQPDPRFAEIETTVKNAYQATITTLASHFCVQELTGRKNLIHKSLILNHIPTLTAAHIDLAARSVIDAAGYGTNFIHTTGHGLGLEIHEQPSLSPKNQEVITKDMAITIEPGIYIPGKFGYRYENTLLLT
jgi:Xaa-Pro dipeptidase